VQAPARTELRFAHGDANADEIQAVVDQVLDELSDPASEAADAAARAGLDPAAAGSAAVLVREGGQGLDPVLTPIIVGITVSAGSKVAESLWKDVLWPRLRRRLGVKAVGDAQGEAE
jgi:hypothetical protein